MAENTVSPIKYLTQACLDKKGQITVPKKYREALALEAGAPISVLQVGNGFLLIPEQARFNELCERIAETFSSHDISAGDILATLPNVRKRIAEGHYPELLKSKPSRKRS
jgi:AbrB family looped-hinge helix DNA binding protein